MTPHVIEQYSRMSSIFDQAPGRNWLHGKASTSKPRSAVRPLQLLELLVLRREPAPRGDVDDEQHLSVVVGQRRLSLPSAVVNGMSRMSVAVASVIPTG